MNDIVAIIDQPLDKWNLIGGLFLLLVGVINMIAGNHALNRRLAERRKAGASEEELAAMQERMGLVRKILVVGNYVVFPLAGFFLFGPVFRQTFGQ